MRILLSSALLGLAWFAAINLVASLTAWVATELILRRRAGSNATLLFAIRLFPALASLVFVLAVFFPAHWTFEPARNDESFGVLLTVLALIAIAVLARSLVRAVKAISFGYRLALSKYGSSHRLAIGALEVGGLSGVSLAGILRPQILIGSEALAALTPAELDVAISHEVAHRQSQDNLKRFLMFCAPDLFGWLPAARHLEEKWQAEAECQADAYAVRGDDTRAVTLASALVKVAKLGRPSSIALQPSLWSAFHVPTLLEMRVRRLVGGAVAAPANGRGLLAGLSMAALAAPAGVWLSGFSHTLHVVTEALVTHLP